MIQYISITVKYQIFPKFFSCFAVFLYNYINFFFFFIPLLFFYFFLNLCNLRYSYILLNTNLKLFSYNFLIKHHYSFCRLLYNTLMNEGGRDVYRNLGNLMLKENWQTEDFEVCNTFSINISFLIKQTINTETLNFLMYILQICLSYTILPPLSFDFTTIIPSPIKMYLFACFFFKFKV